MKIAVLGILLGGCAVSTAHLAAKEPTEVMHSQQSRSTVVDCLLNRITSDDLIPTREIGAASTVIVFNGRGLASRPAIYHFVISDDARGSTIVVRRFAKSSLAVAETCF